MPTADITVNAVTGNPPAGADDVPIDTLVQLNNNVVGDETSHLWAIEDQTAGPVDALSSTSIQNPTFDPQKEGTYRITLIVDLGLSTETRDSVAVGVRQLKTRNRVPAGGEALEASTTRGWAPAVNSMMRAHDDAQADAGLVVAKVSGATVDAGEVVYFFREFYLKYGLPGQETIPEVVLYAGSDMISTRYALAVCVSNIDLTSEVIAGELGIFRVFGPIYPGVLASGNNLGDLVFLTDSGTLDTTPGTYRRAVGYLFDEEQRAAGTYYPVFFNGLPPTELRGPDDPVLELHEEFYRILTDEWTVSLTDTGTALIIEGDGDGLDVNTRDLAGILRLRVAGATDNATLLDDVAWFNGGNNPIFQALVRTPDDVDNGRLRIGMSDNPTSHANYAYFQSDSTSGWDVFCGRSGESTDTDVGVGTCVADTWYVLTIEMDYNNEVRFYVNGVLVSTLDAATSVPDHTDAMGRFVELDAEDGSTHSAYVDWINLRAKKAGVGTQ